MFSSQHGWEAWPLGNYQSVIKGVVSKPGEKCSDQFFPSTFLCTGITPSDVFIARLVSLYSNILDPPFGASTLVISVSQSWVRIYYKFRWLWPWLPVGNGWTVIPLFRMMYLHSSEWIQRYGGITWSERKRWDWGRVIKWKVNVREVTVTENLVKFYRPVNLEDSGKGPSLFGKLF